MDAAYDYKDIAGRSRASGHVPINYVKVHHARAFKEHRKTETLARRCAGFVGPKEERCRFRSTVERVYHVSLVGRLRQSR